jgi:hypothetical protein
MKPPKNRDNFSDADKARIFAWDRAVCAFTGASTWVLDYELSSVFGEDWIDHIKPSARGGSGEAINGVCAEAGSNWTKGANGRANGYWYVGGRPTCYVYEAIGKIPKDVATRLRRDVLPRDWYLNHCIRNLMHRARNMYDNPDYSRHRKRPNYYPNASWRFLEQFRAAWRRDNPSGPDLTTEEALRDWKRRGLLDKSPSRDQLDLLQVLNARDYDVIDRLAKRLSPRVRCNDDWLRRLDKWTGSCDPAEGRRLLRELGRSSQRVSRSVRELIRHNVMVLSGLPRPAVGEDARDIVRRWEYE